MTAAEMIEKLQKLWPSEQILIDKEGCGCCEGFPEGPAVLIRRVADGAILVVAEGEVGSGMTAPPGGGR